MKAIESPKFTRSCLEHEDLDILPEFAVINCIVHFVLLTGECAVGLGTRWMILKSVVTDSAQISDGAPLEMCP